MNIRTQLIRSCATIGLVIISATAISATIHLPNKARTTSQEVHATADAASTGEPLSAVWLPAVAVRARAEPLSETWLPTIHVHARVEHLAMEGAPTIPYARAIAANVPIGVAN